LIDVEKKNNTQKNSEFLEASANLSLAQEYAKSLSMNIALQRVEIAKVEIEN
jgi:hypothetical protein